jgi:SAM-dependent methyltransferase
VVTLIELPRVVPDRPDRPDLGELARSMRELTRAIAMEPDTWTPERAHQIGEMFDALAGPWRERALPQRREALVDALTRGGPFPNGLCVEVGSGTSNATDDLRAAFHHVVSLDLSREMLVHSAVRGRQTQADASALPVQSRSASIVALINMFLFPAEIARVLAPDGVVVWVSTNGDGTPIYLSPAEVVHALPGEWEGVSAQAGWGTWLTARRAGPH